MRRIRQLDDSIVTLVGGPNCEGPMGIGLRRHFPWVDFVVSGEAEETFPDAVNVLLAAGRNADERALPAGYIGPQRAQLPATHEAPRLVVEDLETTPPPNYDDYFDQIVASNFTDCISPGLLLEASRGCWWGEKHPCTFCGLNGLARRYRAKSAERVVEEINLLSRRYSTSKIEFVDNNLDARTRRRICSLVRDRDGEASLFFETRVFGRADLEQMVEAGVKWLQVGIESFDGRVLRLMGKGTSLLQNVQALRWAYQLGVRVTYNVIYGVPGEQDEWYRETSEVLPLLAHLEPPRQLVPLRYDRFSTYWHHPERFGLTLVPRTAYQHVYALPADAIAQFAYYFEDASRGKASPPSGPGFEAFKREWLAWRFAFWTAGPGRERSVLHLLETSGHVLVYDTRPCAAETVAVLSETEAKILAFCDRARRLSDIKTACLPRGDGGETAVAEAVEALRRRRVLLSHDGRFLSLAVTPPRRPPLNTEDFPGGFYYPAVSRLVLDNSLGSVSQARSGSG